MAVVLMVDLVFFVVMVDMCFLNPFCMFCVVVWVSVFGKKMDR